MERFQQALGRAQFRAKGKWYLAQEVDSLLEELSVCLEEDGREREALEGEAHSLRQENARLTQELQEARARLAQWRRPRRRPASAGCAKSWNGSGTASSGISRPCGAFGRASARRWRRTPKACCAGQSPSFGKAAVGGWARRKMTARLSPRCGRSGHNRMERRGNAMDRERTQSRIERFLDLYKQLEDELEDKYRNARRHYSSVVFEFIRDEDSAPVRDQLETCREIRNLLTHSANLGGEPLWSLRPRWWPPWRRC